ncbi:hypothetical protein [Kistimonas asteriae]|uniref:hypothetical protein n=1 Tax=Kistimonas asteriae TaxID=517724 RepID=UPI001BA78B38|nr:hypothetical protein [Kistimonas asteriae]
MDYATEKEAEYVPEPLSLARCIRRCQPIAQLAGKRLSLQTIGSLQKGLAELWLEPATAHPDCASVRADFALMATGLVRCHRRSGLSVAERGALKRLSDTDVKQAVSYLREQPLYLCRSALHTLHALPANLIRDFFGKTLTTDSDNPTACLFSDLYTVGLFNSHQVTLEGFDDVAAELNRWQAQRQQVDPACMGKYLQQLEAQLSTSQDVAAVQRLQRKLDDAIPFWRLGQCLQRHYFRVKLPNNPGLSASLSMIGDHLYRSQVETSFPWLLHQQP